MTDFMSNKTIDSTLLSLIWLAMQYEMNVLISGGTGSGKTSMLNITMPFIPPNQRIISIEDTRELQLPDFLYWCPLVTRLANSEGKGEVNMFDLVINALRMRPDRIIMGEIRQKRDAEVLFEAMHTGHSVYATLHADSMAQTISRLVNPPIAVAPNMLESVNLNIVMFRDRRRGFRRSFQVGEFEVEEKEGKVTVTPNVLYRHNPGDDTIVAHSRAVKLFEDISRHTGLNNDEIKKDLAEKKVILDYLVKHKIRKLDKVGTMMNDYYSDKDLLLKKIEGRKIK
jgi:archaeal flagellar protein FlaI